MKEEGTFSEITTQFHVLVPKTSMIKVFPQLQKAKGLTKRLRRKRLFKTKSSIATSTTFTNVHIKLAKVMISARSASVCTA